MVVPFSEKRPHWKAQRQLGGAGPFAFDPVQRARSHRLFGARSESRGRVRCPRWYAQQQRELHRAIHLQCETHNLAERVISVNGQRDRRVFKPGLHAARHPCDRHQPIIRRFHPGMRRELRPALVHVRGAAPVIRFEPVDIRHRSVRRPPVLVIDRALNLIDLLIVLVRPHVGREGRR